MDKIRLSEALDQVIRENVTVSGTEFVWVGIIENKKARKYKYEMYWLNSVDSLDDLLEEGELTVDINECESRMCESLKQAYSNGYLQIRNGLEESSTTNIHITDLTTRNIEE